MSSNSNLNLIVKKIKLKYWEKSNPDAPWLVKESIAFLKQYLKPKDTILETGSGRSTLWFANLVKEIYSVEHDEEWYNKIKIVLNEKNISNVHYFLENREPNNNPKDSPYVQRVSSFEDNFFDMILIDGKHRGEVALLALSKIKKNGIIVIDNVERHLILDYNFPYQIKKRQEMESTWREFEKATSTFRKVVYENGITATLIVFITK